MVICSCKKSKEIKQSNLGSKFLGGNGTNDILYKEQFSCTCIHVNTSILDVCIGFKVFGREAEVRVCIACEVGFSLGVSKLFSCRKLAIMAHCCETRQVLLDTYKVYSFILDFTQHARSSFSSFTIFDFSLCPKTLTWDRINSFINSGKMSEEGHNLRTCILAPLHKYLALIDCMVMQCLQY